MNRDEFIKKIIIAGTINKNLFLFSLKELKGSLCNTSFLMTLQEIDSSIYKYYPPMEIDEVVILDKMILFFNYQDCIDLDQKKSIFLASNPNHLIMARNNTLIKLENFFKKPRFHNSLFDIDLKINIREFINQFVEYKLKLLIDNCN